MKKASAFITDKKPGKEIVISSFHDEKGTNVTTKLNKESMQN
jgi:hypothetical protein